MEIFIIIFLFTQAVVGSGEKNVRATLFAVLLLGVVSMMFI